MAHEEFDRRRRVQRIAGRLADTDVTVNLLRSEAYQLVQPAPDGGWPPKIRQQLEFCRSEAMVLPKCPTVMERRRLAQGFGSQCLIQPVNGHTGVHSDPRWIAASLRPHRAPAMRAEPLSAGMGLASWIGGMQVALQPVIVCEIKPIVLPTFWGNVEHKRSVHLSSSLTGLAWAGVRHLR